VDQLAAGLKSTISPVNTDILSNRPAVFFKVQDLSKALSTQEAFSADERARR